MANESVTGNSHLIDENYADLIVENDALDRYPADSQTVDINYKYSVVNIPAEFIEKCSLGTIPYSEFPRCYTLESAKALEETGVSQIQRNPNFNLFGKGTLVGIIDTGIDYRNKVFRYKDGRTRIVSIWDQTINNDTYPPLGFPYGAEYSRAIIDNALESANPLELVPSVDTNGHGTYIAGIAAGSEDVDNNFSGVVPESELVVVKLKYAKDITKSVFNISSSVKCYQETDIMFGVKYVISVAAQLKRPIAVCIALGTSQGSHSGQEPLSAYLSFLNPLIGVGITVSAGNEGNSRRHYLGTFKSNESSKEFELNVDMKDKMFPLEIWQLSPSKIAIEVISPTGEQLPMIYPDLTSCYKHSFIFEPTVIWINNILSESASGQELIIVRFENAMNGIWRFRIFNLSQAASTFNVWLPSGDIISNDTYLLNSSPDTTITAPADSSSPLTVSSYNPVNGAIAITASRGYSSINTIKPELASPGINIKGPTLAKTYGEFTGTGVAAAFATGITAMAYEWAIVNQRYPDLNGNELKQLLIRGAKTDPSITYPNEEWGYGQINIYEFFNKLRE